MILPDNTLEGNILLDFNCTVLINNNIYLMIYNLLSSFRSHFFICFYELIHRVQTFPYVQAFVIQSYSCQSSEFVIYPTSSSGC